MSAAGKKNRLKTKYPMKLWPLRPATRAGQNAIAIQMTANKIHHKTDMTCPLCVPCGTLITAAGWQRRHQPRCRTAPFCTPPRHHPGKGDPRGRAEDCGRGREVAGQRVPVSALPLSAGATSPSSWPHRGDVAPGHGRRDPRVDLLTGLEGLVGDCVLLGGTAELAQLRRDHRRLVEGRQDVHRCLAVGELAADALAVGGGQSQPLMVQGPGRRTTDHADSHADRAEEDERRSDPGALAGAPGADLLLFQLSGRVDRENPDGVGGGEPGVFQIARCVVCGCLVVEDREDQRPVCHCVDLPSGWDSMSRAASRRSATLAPGDVAQTLRPPIWSPSGPKGDYLLPEGGGITRA